MFAPTPQSSPIQPPNYDEPIVKLLEQAEDKKNEGSFEEAISLLNKILVTEPECFEAYEELGDNYISLRELKKAGKALVQALKINEASANAHYLLGFLYSLEQKWNESVESLTKADEIFPNHPEILRCLGWSCYNESRSIQGIALLERSEALSPSDPNILCDLGVCYLNSGFTEKAEQTFRKVVKLDPDSDQAQECLAFLKMMGKK